MRCERCGRDFAAGLDRCPNCGSVVHYGGKTEFYGKSVRAKLRIKDLFTDVFKKHPAGAGARMFMAGTPTTTPTPDRMLQEWDKPWLFMRVLAVGLLFGLLNFFMAVQLGHPLGVYLLFTLCALILPLGILTFYWEVNIPRDIPIYRVFVIFLIGGMLSLIFTLLLPAVDGPAYLAPLTEEPGKVIALAIFLYLLDTKYIFGGLLIGAAVGAGFSAFENIFYVMMTESLDTLITRSLLTVGGHVTWAAIEGGALALVKGNDKLRPKHFTDPRFLVCLAVTMALHCVWNSEISLLPLPLFADLKYVILCVAAVYAAFSLIKKAIAQVLAASGGDQSQQSPQFLNARNRAKTELALTAVSGPLAGTTFPLRKRVTIGRDPNSCNLIFPPNTPGVSRRHCSIEVRPDGVYIMDHGSSAGTFLQSGQRFPANQWILLHGSFYLGTPAVSFTLSSQSVRA